MLPTVIESAVTPTSVAPPFPPAGAAFSPVAPAVGSPPAAAPAPAVASPPVAPLVPPPVAAAVLPPANRVPPPPVPRASATCASLARDPQAATRARVAASATNRRRVRPRGPTPVPSACRRTSDPPNLHRQKVDSLTVRRPTSDSCR